MTRLGFGEGGASMYIELARDRDPKCRLGYNCSCTVLDQTLAPWSSKPGEATVPSKLPGGQKATFPLLLYYFSIMASKKPSRYGLTNHSDTCADLKSTLKL